MCFHAAATPNRAAHAHDPGHQRPLSLGQCQDNVKATSTLCNTWGQWLPPCIASVSRGFNLGAGNAKSWGDYRAHKGTTLVKSITFLPGFSTRSLIRVSIVSTPAHAVCICTHIGACSPVLNWLGVACVGSGGHAFLSPAVRSAVRRRLTQVLKPLGGGG